MTLIIDDKGDAPGTHVLAIGVGDYPFLKDGSAPPVKRFPLHMNMGQLGSPPRSVEKLALWFLDDQAGFNNPDRPLRSLEVLCSAPARMQLPDGRGGLQAVSSATRANVHAAVLEFKKRAARNAENLALFYFCGHGLAYSDTENVLLPADFGQNHDDPMSDAIAFDRLWIGLKKKCGAAHLVAFIDACRTAPTGQFIAECGADSTGQAIIAGGVSRKLAPVFFATGLLASAYGIPDQPSLFTQGLLRCFRGVGARDEDGGWQITVPAVAEAINKSVESLEFERQPQFCHPRENVERILLHRLRGEPEVLVKVCTREPQLMTQTILAHTSEANPVRVTREPLALPWWVHLAYGKYLFEALSRDNVVISQRDKHVAPPGADVVL